MKIIALRIIVSAIAVFMIFSNVHADSIVRIATLQSVKIHPPPEPVRKELPDGRFVFEVTNSCGSAEAKYQVSIDKFLVLSMILGEWCANPSDELSRWQIIVYDTGEELKEYYSIFQDTDGRDYVIPRSWSEIAKAKWSPLLQPVVISELENPGEASYYSRHPQVGQIKIEGLTVYQTQAVFLENISQLVSP